MNEKHASWTREMRTISAPRRAAIDPAACYASDLDMHPQQLLAGQRVLITGGGRGIGGGLVVEALRHGAQVVSASLDEEPHIVAAVRGLKGGNERLTTVMCDLRDREQVQHVAESHLVDIDTVIFNAGITLSSPFLTTSMDQARALFEVNVFSAIQLAQTACRYMIKRPISPQTGRRGQLVFFTSTHALGAMGCHSTYAATKLAIEGIAKHIATESNKEGWEVRVNLVRPGWVLTEEQVRVRGDQMPNASREALMASFCADAERFPGYTIYSPRSFAEALLRRISIPGMHDQGSTWDLSGGQSTVFPGAEVIAADNCPAFGRRDLRA